MSKRLNVLFTKYHIQYTAYKRGFTIVELLVVIVVIGILAAITIVSYTGISGRAINSSVKSDISQAYKQLEISKTTSSTDAYPVDLASSNLKSSNGTTYAYYSDSPYKSYCLVATNSTTVYSISGSNPTPIIGNCLSNGLVGYWALDNTTGMTDLSGNGNNGTANGGIAIGAAANHLGTANKATSFDGVDDYVDVGKNQSLKITTGTIGAWVYPRTSSGFDGVFSYLHSYGSGYPGYGMGYRNGGLAFIIGDTTYREYAGQGVIPVNQWRYMLVTLSQTTMGGYINGVNVVSIDKTISPTYNSNDSAQIGSFDITEAYLWDGLISDLRVYNRVFSQAEITALYNL